MKNEKMSDLRKEKGLSQVEVAKQAGISTRQYQRVEAGEHLPNVAPAIKIAQILGTTVEKLFPI
ncbi:helix-turn-helix transcriptional regulator [Enterococcus faecium]|nr:helix-turn-helix transcriptional regulator [Enterococcus faecium]